CVPATSAASGGSVAVESLEVICTVSVGVLTKFQFASTELIVTLKELNALCVVGVPLLPVVLPGEADSPGANTCNFANAPAFTFPPALVLAVSTAAASLAVIVRVPAVLKVKLDNVRVPPISVILPAVAPLSSAMLALLSELVMVTLFVALLTMFQLAST